MLPEPTIRLALVDHQQLYTNLLRHFLQQQSNLTVETLPVGTPPLKEQLSHLAALPDVLLIDMDLPTLHIESLAQWLKNTHPNIRLIIMAKHCDAQLTRRLFALQVSSFLSKNHAPPQLLEAIHQVHQNGYYFLPDQLDLLRQTLDAPPKSPQKSPVISPREREILQLLCEQKTAQEIANLLFITRRTVEGHKTRLLNRTGVKNTVGLVLYAIRTGIVDFKGLSLRQ